MGPAIGVVCLMVLAMFAAVCIVVLLQGGHEPLFDEYGKITRSLTRLMGIGMVISFVVSASYGVVSISNAVTPNAAYISPLESRMRNSATAQELAANADALLGQMETLGLTQGYNNFLYQNPGTDMAVTYQHVKILRDRALEVASISGDNSAYGLTVVDLKKAASKTRVDASDYFFVRLQEPVNAFYAWFLGVALLIGAGLVNRWAYIERSLEKSRRANLA